MRILTRLLRRLVPSDLLRGDVIDLLKTEKLEEVDQIDDFGTRIGSSGAAMIDDDQRTCFIIILIANNT